MISVACHFSAGAGFPGPEEREEEPKGGAGDQALCPGSAFKVGFAEPLGSEEVPWEMPLAKGPPGGLSLEEEPPSP